MHEVVVFSSLLPSIAIKWLIDKVKIEIIYGYLFAPEIGYQVLAQANVTGVLADVALYGGSLLDLLIGLWLLSNRYIAWCCKVQLVVMAIFTGLLSVVDPSFWLHPFGPLTKNLPMAVLVIGLWRSVIDEKVDD